MTGLAPRLAAWAYAGLSVLGLGLFLLELPIQVSDSFGNMLKLDASWRDLMVGEFSQRAYLRPFLWAELKLVYDAAAGGNYFAWFRGVHVAQVAVLVALFVHLARPRTWLDAAVLPLGLAALIGSQTFTGTVVEAYPVNTFMTILICTLAVAAVSLADYRWWHDMAAALIFIVAALTVESGLIVAVIVVSGFLVGARGVSRAGVVSVVALFVGYFVLRFHILQVGSPALIERASGFGFSVLEPEELMTRFGNNPLPYYAYNIVSSALMVLFGEPRGGVWQLLRGVSLGDVYEPLIAVVLGTTLTTAVIVGYAWSRRRSWLSRAFDHNDRLVLVFFMVLGGNAVICYPYTKDVVMSPAGAFYALAAYASVRHVVARSAPRVSFPRTALVSACCAVLAVTWAVRNVGTHANLRSSAHKVRNEWAYVEGWAERQGMDITEPRAAALMRTLKRDAIVLHPAPPQFPLPDRYLDVQ